MVMIERTNVRGRCVMRVLRAGARVDDGTIAGG